MIARQPQMLQMSAAETGHMSVVESRERYSIKTGQSPVAIEDTCLVSTADICPVSTEDIYPVSTCTSKDRKAH